MRLLKNLQKVLKSPIKSGILILSVKDVYKRQVLLFAIGAVMMFVGGTSLVWFGAAIGGLVAACLLYTSRCV